MNVDDVKQVAYPIKWQLELDTKNRRLFSGFKENCTKTIRYNRGPTNLEPEDCSRAQTISHTED